jgi:hypothetical protein
MKKTLLLAIVSALSFNCLFAQASLVFSSDTVTVEDEVDTDDNFFEIVAYGTLFNTGDEPITIRWERFIVDAPEEWSVLVCDINQCYEPIVYSNIADDIGLNAPVTLEPGGSTNMDVHVRPVGKPGNAVVNIEIADANAPDDVLITSRYELTATSPTSTRELSVPTLSIFPNPATDYIQIRNSQDVDRLVVYNIVGQEMRSFNAAPGQRYFIGDLPNGLYLASLVSHEKGILTTLRVQKSALRP